MNPIRLLLLIALIWLAFHVAKRLRSAVSKNVARPKRAATRMVRCHRCGVHVPEGDAVHDGDRSYCSIEHRRQDA